MRIMCIQSKTLSVAFRGCKWGYLVFQRKRLKPRVLPWQQNNRSRSVSFVTYITGAKFEDHCFNILEDIFDSVFYHLCRTSHHFPHLHNTKLEYLENEKRYSKKENTIRLDSKNPFK